MTSLHRSLTGLALLAAATAASAHTGHGTHSLAEGLAHPFGLDHLLAMVAVGLWSATALPARLRASGPLVFLALMAAGAAAGAAGLALPLVEAAIALSVSVLGAMLLAPRALPAGLGLALVAAAAGLHGLAHGAEQPFGAAFGSYAAGFLFTTAALHGLGLFIGQRWLALHRAATVVVGSALGVAGVVLWALA
jgi:urease accessory protein